MPATIDLTKVRQKFGNVEVVEVLEELQPIYGKLMRMVRLLCKACDKKFDIPLSRWQNQPARNCQACALIEKKKFKWGNLRKS